MEIIYVLLEFLHVELAKLEKLSHRGVNKSYKRFVRLLRDLTNHLQDEKNICFKSLESFKDNFSKNKSRYGELVSTPLTLKTKEVLRLLIDELKQHISVFTAAGKELELQITKFVKNSAQALLDNNFCKKQEVLLSQLKTGHLQGKGA